MVLFKAKLLLFTMACIRFIDEANANNHVTRTNLQTTLNIKERGTKFSESIEIIGEESVIYHVPSHNDVEESDVFVDYKERLSVTRLPRLEECHIRELDADESSPHKILLDIVKFKLIYKEKPRSIRTIKRTMVKRGKILSPSAAVTKFCGTYQIYKMAIINFADFARKIKGHSIQKRSRTSYLSQLSSYVDGGVHGEQEPPTDDDGKDDDDNKSNEGSASGSGSGYMQDLSIMSAQEYKEISQSHCKMLHNYDMKDCIEEPIEKWNFTQVQTSHSCVYMVKCRKSKIINDKLVPAGCIEQHHSSYEVCYDLSCKTPSQA